MEPTEAAVPPVAEPVAPAAEPTAPEATEAGVTEPAADADAKIQSAMSAARPAIAEEATIVDYPAEATDPLIVPREGNNGWTWFPDWLATPGNDPMCLDET